MLFGLLFVDVVLTKETLPACADRVNDFRELFFDYGFAK
jgi:hypothetical protein